MVEHKVGCNTGRFVEIDLLLFVEGAVRIAIIEVIRIDCLEHRSLTRSRSLFELINPLFLIGQIIAFDHAELWHFIGETLVVQTTKNLSVHVITRAFDTGRDLHHWLSIFLISVVDVQLERSRRQSGIGIVERTDEGRLLVVASVVVHRRIDLDRRRFNVELNLERLVFVVRILVPDDYRTVANTQHRLRVCEFGVIDPVCQSIHQCAARLHQTPVIA